MILIAILLAFVIATLLHRFVLDFWLASVASGIVSVAILAMLGQPHLGWFDNAFYENVTVLFLLSIGIAFGVGE